MKKPLFILFFIIIFSKGVLATLGIPQLVVEALILAIPILILFESNRSVKPPPGLLLVVLYTLWSILASIYNDGGLIRGLLLSRCLIIGYLVMWAVWKSNLNEVQFKTINKYIFIIFFVQVFVALYEIFFIGRTEAMVGTISSGGGGAATTFPMFAFAFMFAFFIYSRRFVYLLAGSSFMIVGYASGKLGIYYLIPILALIGFLLFFRLERINVSKKRVMVWMVGAIIIILAIVILLPYASHRTERLSLENTSLQERIFIFWEYTRQSETRDLDRQSTTGSRIGTSLRVIEETFSRNITVFLFGQGFTAVSETSGRDRFGEYGISYGITGWTYDALSIGWPGMFFHVSLFSLLFYKLIKLCNHKIFKPYWRIIIFATLLNYLNFLIIYFTYNAGFSVGGLLISVHMYFTGILLAPKYKIFLSTYDLSNMLKNHYSRRLTVNKYVSIP
jgi:hypothetical protein